MAERTPPAQEGSSGRATGQISQKLAHYGDTLNAEGLETHPLERYGAPAECIVAEARRISADYIVMGSHGHTALYDALVGSITGWVLKHAPCPVVVVPVLGPGSGFASAG